MKISNILFRNFRNYEEVNLNLDSNINIFYGNNAQGKTNILEGIYYTAFGFSFRTKNEEELIKFKENFYATNINFSDNFGKNEISIKRKNKKELLLNGNNTSNKEYYGNLNVVLFSPDDLQIIKGDPSLRRKFLNMEIAQTNKFYYALLLKYNKILAQRNKFLKSQEEKEVKDFTQLDIWDKELSEVASEIIKIRLNAIHKLNTIAANIYNALTQNNEKFILSYALKTSEDFTINPQNEDWNKWYLEELKKRRTLDLLRKSTSIGPHRDDLIVEVNDNNLKAFGSQGQQRSGALVLKLAELEFIKEIKEEYPILLLDDVMSELDSKRREQLLHFIDGKVQTFITVNDKNLVNVLPNSKFYYVENGVIREEI